MSAERYVPQPSPDNTEGGYSQPAPEPGVSPQDITGFITSLVKEQASSHPQEERGLSNPREVAVYESLSDLYLAAPPIWRGTVGNVWSAYGSLMYDRLPVSKKVIFLIAAREEHEARGIDLILTQEEGDILRHIANDVGIEYDPGEPGDTEKKTFTLAAIESKAPDRAEIPPLYKRLLDITEHPQEASQ